MNKEEEMQEYSDLKRVIKNAKKYLGRDVLIRISNLKNKKFMVFDKSKSKWIHFGQMGYKDFTKTQDIDKREKYLKRSLNIKGNWKDDIYSPNNLSRNILWM